MVVYEKDRFALVIRISYSLVQYASLIKKKSVVQIYLSVQVTETTHRKMRKVQTLRATCLNKIRDVNERGFGASNKAVGGERLTDS